MKNLPSSLLNQLDVVTVDHLEVCLQATNIYSTKNFDTKNMTSQTLKEQSMIKFFAWSNEQHFPRWTFDELSRWAQSATVLKTKEMLLQRLKKITAPQELALIATAYSAYLKFNPEAFAAMHFSVSSMENNTKNQIRLLLALLIYLEINQKALF